MIWLMGLFVLIYACKAKAEQDYRIEQECKRLQEQNRW
jgi:hypothetical protein